MKLIKSLSPVKAAVDPVQIVERLEWVSLSALFGDGQLQRDLNTFKNKLEF